MSTCDKATRSCSGRTTEWLLWKVDAAEATKLVLCKYHSEPFVQAINFGKSAPLPRPSRADFKITELKTTKQTKVFKK